MAVTKWSVSVEETLAARIESHVGDRGLSGFVARAVEHELERDLLDEYLVELDNEFGPLPAGLVEQQVPVDLAVAARRFARSDQFHRRGADIVHVLAVGAVGVMPLAVMSRAAVRFVAMSASFSWIA